MFRVLGVFMLSEHHPTARIVLGPDERTEAFLLNELDRVSADEYKNSSPNLPLRLKLPKENFGDRVNLVIQTEKVFGDVLFR